MDIALNSSGEPVILGEENQGGALLMANLSGGAWTNDEVAPSTSGGVALAVDGSDAAHVLFADSSVLTYAYLDGATWTLVPVDDTTEVATGATHFDIAVDGSGTAHVAWEDRLTRTLNYAVFNGAGFDVTVVDAPTQGDDQFGDYVTLTVGADGTVHLAYMAMVSSAYVLRYASGSSSGFTVEDVPGEGEGVFAAIDLDSSGNPHIFSSTVSQNRGEGIYWSQYDGSSWTETEVPLITTGVHEMDATLDSLDRPHIAYAAYMMGLGNWVYVRYDGESFTFQEAGVRTIDSPDYIALALDDNDMPHIAISSGGGTYLHF